MTWIVVTLSISIMAQPNNRALVPSDIRCGSYCLYVGLKALDVPIKDYASFEKELGQPGPLGYSMDQLAEVSRKQGLYAEGFVTSLESLARRPGRFLCIALLDRGHFVNVYDIEGGKLFLVDPPGKQVVTADAFKAMWSGKVLLISDKPLVSDNALVPWYRRGFFLGSAALLITVGLMIGGRRAYRALL